jgi:glycosyltransferase involved in cell wall biosynthesis/peptidoglycan/xylan/chitin deacetylase (PgdA/CDA1 family)
VTVRVLLLSPTLGLGGAERLAVLYAEGLKQRGHEVLMAFGRRSRWDAHAFSPTVETRLLTEVQLTPKTMLPWVRALRTLVRDFKPDVLFTQSITVAAVAGIAAPRIPHVVMLHGIPDDQERLAAVVLRTSRAHAVAVSDQTAHGITRHRGAPPVETLRSGIDITALERNAEVPIDPPLPDGSPRYIYIGRFVHQKATEILVAAFAQVVAQYPQAQLVCAGIGPELDERKQQAADLGVAERIVFLGAVGNVAPYIRASDAFVLSSRWEGLPVVLLETLALGTPAIATAVDGSPLVVRDGDTGWLAPPEDVDAFAAQMLEAAADPAERKRRGANGRALIAREYDAERVLDRIDAMLREAVAPLPLPPRPYHAAVRRLERARTRRAASDGLSQPDGVRILAYHRVIDAPGDPLAVTPGEFAEQMETLAASGHVVVSLTRAVELLRAGPIEGRYACVTFDDGYRDNVDNALPVLERLGIEATIFAVTGILDGTSSFHWYRDPPPALTWADVEELLRGDVFDVQPHSRTHASLPALDTETARDEIIGSTRVLDAHRPTPSTVFSYPAGRFGTREQRLVQEAGLAAAVGTGTGVNTGLEDGLLALRRTLVRPDTAPSEFAAVLDGALDEDSWLHRKVRARRARG